MRCAVLGIELGKPGAKDAKVFLLVCFDPGRKTKDQNTPSPDGRLLLQVAERC